MSDILINFLKNPVFIQKDYTQLYRVEYDEATEVIKFINSRRIALPNKAAMFK